MVERVLTPSTHDNMIFIFSASSTVISLCKLLAVVLLILLLNHLRLVLHLHVLLRSGMVHILKGQTAKHQRSNLTHPTEITEHQECCRNKSRQTQPAATVPETAGQLSDATEGHLQPSCLHLGRLVVPVEHLLHTLPGTMDDVSC